MTTKHTPGPWSPAYLDHAGQRVVKGEHIEICTCWHHSVMSIEKEMEANARIIAAAPDMFEALDRSLSWLASYPGGGASECYDQARSAIAKARGEG